MKWGKNEKITRYRPALTFQIRNPVYYTRSTIKDLKR